VNSKANVKAPSSTDLVADQPPKKESEVRMVLAIAVFVFLLNYFEKGFSNWFGLSNPPALALAILSAYTVSVFIHRPRKLFGFFEPKRPILILSLLGAAMALVAYIVARVQHF
jgi:hypothetical protein